MENLLPCSIDELDLSALYLKLQDAEGESWSLEQCKSAEKEYRRFLKLVKLYPGESIVPTKTMDIFWHYHILDTRKYIKDCNDIFGFYLHHYPYFGLKGDSDKQLLDECFKLTCNLYKQTFNTELVAENGTSCTHGDDGANCVSSGCKATY